MRDLSVMIAATGSGSGKTLITCALLEAFKQKNYNIRAFKCGPDYIDPMFHEQIIGVPSRNLDTFFLEDESIRHLFYEQEEDAKTDTRVSVIEGVMGLYDGLGGIRKEGSAYHLATVLKVPIVLVVDAAKMGRSVVAMIAGFLQYDTMHLIKGVILNRISSMYYETIAPIIEEELSIKVFGCFPKQTNLQIESRHLGLKLPHELEDLKMQIQHAADVLCENVDVDALYKCMEKEVVFNQNMMGSFLGQVTTRNLPKIAPVQIAVARDEAFCFYYEDNLKMLEAAGARLIYFSPIHDKQLPDYVDGILLGGGYPELVADKLFENQLMRESIQNAIKRGVPSVAECGGFMYLHDKMVLEDGTAYDMCGVIPGSVSYRNRLVRFGYIELEIHDNKRSDEHNANSIQKFLWENEKIRAHEFHYFESEQNGADCIATKPVSQRTYECIHCGENYWWGFPHLYYPSNAEFPIRFVECARQFRDKR